MRRLFGVLLGSLLAGVVSVETSTADSIPSPPSGPAVRVRVATPSDALPSVDLRTASTHPMKYWVSRPAGWTAAKRWPVLVVIESAERQFEATAQRFAAARKAQPVIVVVPIVMGGGGSAERFREAFPYDAATWTRFASEGACRFDDEGLAAVLADVRRLDGGEDRAWIAGFEAGMHVVFPQLFRRPERWLGVIGVAPNYQSRCMEDGAFSPLPTRSNVHFAILHGGDDRGWAGSPLATQTAEALRQARAHGFATASERSVQGHAHEWMEDAVWALVAEWRSAGRGR